MRYNGRVNLAIVISLLMVSSLLVVAHTDNMAGDDGSAVATANSNTGVQFAGGDGSVGDPYQIEDVSQLQHVQENLSAHYVLIDDIDASGTGDWNDGAGFEPIASIAALDPEDPEFSPDAEFVFNGTFDGDGHVISDLVINRPAEAGVGLFGIVYEHANIVDVGLENVSVSGGSAVGTLVAWNLGTVQDSYATGELEGNNVAGGLVGASSGSIIDSFASVKVSEATSAGGLVGMNEGDVIDSYATGDVHGQSSVGGLAGIHAIGEILRSHARGDVNGDMLVGGLVGMNNGTVSQSYAIGDVTNEEAMIAAAGGLVAASDGNISESYATGDVVYEGWDGYFDNAAALGGLLGVNDGIVSDSYSMGMVSGEAEYGFIGGLVGLNESFDVIGFEVFEDVDGEVQDSFWDTETSDVETSAGGEGVTTSGMKELSTLTDAGWDASQVWAMDDEFNHGYPYLQYQFDEAVDALVVGSVEDSDGDPVPGASIHVDGIKVAATNHDGDYFFVIGAGDHQIKVEKEDYESGTSSVTALSGTTSEADTMTLQSEDPADPEDEEDDDDEVCFGILTLVGAGMLVLPLTLFRRKG